MPKTGCQCHNKLTAWTETTVMHKHEYVYVIIELGLCVPSQG